MGNAFLGLGFRVLRCIRKYRNALQSPMSSVHEVIAIHSGLVLSAAVTLQP